MTLLTVTPHAMHLVAAAALLALIVFIFFVHAYLKTRKISSRHFTINSDEVLPTRSSDERRVW